MSPVTITSVPMRIIPIRMTPAPWHPSSRIIDRYPASLCVPRSSFFIYHTYAAGTLSRVPPLFFPLCLLGARARAHLSVLPPPLSWLSCLFSLSFPYLQAPPPSSPSSSRCMHAFVPSPSHHHHLTSLIYLSIYVDLFFLSLLHTATPTSLRAFVHM